MTALEKYRKKNPVAPIPELGAFRHCAVIPCFDENDTLKHTLVSLNRSAAEAGFPVAILVVVNYPEGRESRSSEILLERLKNKEFPGNIFSIYAPALKGGVGEARKIGMDCFLQEQTPADLPECIIYSMDADTLVSPDYFLEVSHTLAASPCGGVSIGLHHLPGATPEEESAIRRYEAYLDRYVEKLQNCSSPYAFHTVGSAFAVKGDAYIRCGGMKIRQAGEDFYFLQALSKSCGVESLKKTLVYPSARISGRTPFGTGQSVADLLSGKSLPEIPDEPFERLKALLDRAVPENLLRQEPELPEKDFMLREKFFDVWPGIKRNTPPEQILRAFHTWFDGLRTLRFLHYCCRQDDFSEKKEKKVQL